jgi:integrase
MSTVPPPPTSFDNPRRLKKNRLTAPPKVPNLCRHRPSGQAYVRLSGRTIYIGPYDQPDTRRKYDKLIAEWLASGRHVPQPGEELTVTELVSRFMAHVQGYYVNSVGEPTDEQRHMQNVLGMVRQLYGDSPAARFGPKSLLTLRHQMIGREWKRLTVNLMVSRVKRMFRWGTEQELVPGSVFHALQAVAGLRRGRCDAPDGEPVRPVKRELVDPIEPFVSPQVWAMVQLQLLTAARPGEICVMKPRDIDRSGAIWVYHPSEHKTSFRGYERNIYIGPRAQEALSPFLLRVPDDYCFSPLEADDQRRAILHEARVTPDNEGNSPGTNRRIRPEKKPGPFYIVASYRRAIEYGSDHAFPPPGLLRRQEGETNAEYRRRLTPDQKQQVRAWRKAHRWHPHQLRHNAATELRKEFGLEAARIILGHRSAAVTMIYAEADQQKAIEVIQKVG